MDMLVQPHCDPNNLHQYRGASRITSPPPSDSPLAYREDDLVEVLTNIYQHLIDISYLEPSWVTFPPTNTGRHALDVNYLREELHMSSRVVSLLERLPFIDSSARNEVEWYPQATAVDYRDVKVARRARDPGSLSCFATGKFPSQTDVEVMRPADVALAFPANGDCQYIILDTEANSIRLMYDLCELPNTLRNGPLEVPEHPSHYRNHAGYHAPSVLRRYYEDLRTLQCFPEKSVNAIGNVYHTPTAYIGASVMRQYFGWPGHFRKEAWGSVIDKMENEIFESAEYLAPYSIEEIGEERMQQITGEVATNLGLDEIEILGTPNESSR